MQKTKPHWLAMYGNAEISESSIRFVGRNTSKKKSAETADKLVDLVPTVVVRSEVYFESGDIHGEIFIEDSSAKVQFRISSEDTRRVFVGLNVCDCPYGISVMDGSGLTPINTAGKGSNPPTGEWFPFQIKVRGTYVEFFIKGVRVAHGHTRIIRSQLELVLKGTGVMEVRNITMQTVRPQVFVVMQFTDEYTALYRDVIDPVCSEYGYEVIRGDNVYTNGLIIEDIAQSIRSSAVIIADITPNNSNVYYEVGFAHGIGKATILLSDRVRDKMPFDISGFRLLFYDNTIGGKSAVEAALRKHLDAIRGA